MGLLWAELLILQTMIGYCFVIANACIGIYNIRDLNNMKGDIVIVKAHKWIGWIESTFFYAITIQCLTMVVLSWIDPLVDVSSVYVNVSSTQGWHAMIGGIVGFSLFTFKFTIARHFKDIIYKWGQYIGPIGFVGWSIAHFTSMINFYFMVRPAMGYATIIYVLPQYFVFAVLLPIPIGIAIFLGILVKRGGTEGTDRWSVHQIAFILHGITFGYEGAAKELLGTPALFKYVIPKSYKFLEKMMEDVLGFNLEELERMNVNEALDIFMKKSAEIGMAEKIKIKWLSDKDFIVESVNCSTAKVRSVMDPEELENAICPWAIMAAAIVNKSIGKDLEIAASEFNEIGALTKLSIKEE